MFDFNHVFKSMTFKSSTESKLFQDMFTDYMSDLPLNFYLNQFELAKKYSRANYLDWTKFLTHPAFDTWKAEQIAIIATTETNKALAGGDLKDKEALNLLKVRQDVLKDENTGQKPVIIVIPESLFFKDGE